MNLKHDIYEAVVAGDAPTADRLVAQALEAGIPAEELLREALVAAMGKVGELFECGDYYVSEMLISAKAMKAGMAHLRPHLTARAIEPIGKVVIGTVKGDLHDIGKNVVAMMLEGTGFQVIDLGVNVPAERFVQAAQESQADLVAVSALLTTTMPGMRAIVEALRTAGLPRQVKVIVGGAPLTQEFADEIGADGFAPDAAAGANRARQLVETER